MTFVFKFRWLSVNVLTVFVIIGWTGAFETSFAQVTVINSAHEYSTADLEFFENEVRPLLVSHCLECHGDHPKKIGGGLNLTTRAGILAGGDSGPSIEVGNPVQSLLLKAVNYEAFEMPPTGQLAPDEIETLRRWVEMGAPDPRTSVVDTSVVSSVSDEEIANAAKNYWAFQPVADHQPPTDLKNSTWPATKIDRFILARLEQSKLPPAADTDRSTLLRRVYFAVTGLPPTVSEIENFVTSPRPLDDDLAVVVDRLLASDQFGERWGRHWLDVARFAESSGGGRSLMFPLAWRYRDYVIESFNQDKPFDQFIREQIAGDLLPFDSHPQKIQQIVGSGFLTLGPTNYEHQDKEELRMEVIDEQVDTIGRAFLALTLGCARCHDHKFDPISTRDYYSLAGIFSNTETLVAGNVSGYVTRSLATDSETKAISDHSKSVTQATRELKTATQEHARLTAQSTADKTADTQNETSDSKKQELSPLETEELLAAKRRVQKFKTQLEELKKQSFPQPPQAMSVKEATNPQDGHIHIRGNVRTLGEVVQRGCIDVLSVSANPAPIPHDSSGRLQLADWIASSQHPLTARVYVNRVWRQLFGKGLVRTTDNFGEKGEQASHPELLDFLAARFVDEGWSTKTLIRQIVMSRTFRLDSQADPHSLSVDPENRLWGRADHRRADVEVLRDSILSISGQLDLKAGGLTIQNITEYDSSYEFNTCRRSVYVPGFRNSMLEMFEVFDVANPNLVVGDRSTSTLPTQALFMLNSPFIIEQAKISAQRLLAETENGLKDDGARLRTAYMRTLGRPPTPAESKLSLDYLQRSIKEETTAERQEAWTSLFHTLFASLDFRFIY